MFKNNNHGLFCYCTSCRAKRRLSFFYNVIISALMLVVFYQGIIMLFAFTRLNCFLLFIELVVLTFVISRSLF